MLRHLFAAASIASLALPALGADVCNGHAELCDKSYSSVTFLGAHNSFGVGDSIAANQHKNVTAQLNDGIRTMSIQAHNSQDAIHLCHSSCSLLDGGPMVDYLSAVTEWVKANPSEVITIVIVNSDNLPPSSYDALFQSSGLASYTYSPSASATSISDWPTLGTLIDSGKTVMVYMDYNADFTSVPYIMDEFSNLWQDAYDVTSTEWGCAVNRSSGNAGSMMYLVNHFLNTAYSIGGTSFYTPNKDAINTTNAEPSLAQHVGNCNSLWGRNPNHILLDYYESNSNAPFDYVAQLNGVSAPTNTVEQVVSASTASTGTQASGSGANAQISSSSLGGAAGRLSVGWGMGLAVGAVGAVVGASAMWI